jgi:hypothetical protein
MSRIWWLSDEVETEWRLCHTAGIALHLFDLLPQPADEGEHLRNVARAAGLVIPGSYGMALPEDRTDLAARARVARALLDDVREHVGDDDSADKVLIGIAHDAVVALSAANELAARDMGLGAVGVE